MTNYREKTTERERKRPLLLLAGLLFACGLTLLSFEYRVERRISEQVIIPSRTVPTDGPVIAVPLPEPPKAQVKQVKATVVLPEQITVTDKILNDAEPDPGDRENNGYNYGDIEIDGIETRLPPEDLSPAPFYERPEFTATFSDCGDITDPRERFACTEQKLTEYLGRSVTFHSYLYDRGVGGIVEVSFLIGTDGRVQDVEIVQGVHRELDSQVVNALLRMKPWTPAKQGSHIVKQKFSMTVNF